MGLFRKYNQIVGEFRCGVHSGYRLCDVLWYCLAWSPFGLYKFKSAYAKWYNRTALLGNGVKCPICAIIKPEPIKSKPCDCTNDYTMKYLLITNFGNWFNRGMWNETMEKSSAYKKWMYAQAKLHGHINTDSMREFRNQLDAMELQK